MLREFGEAILDLDTPKALQFQLGEARRLIACSIAGRSQAPEKGLTVIDPALPVIDMAELVRWKICEQLDDTWAWVAMGPERQPDATAGAPGVAQDAPVINEGGQADPTPVQAPPPPPAAARTMP
ncbi:hypothetical protein Tco_1339563 [Tanacetum coccineum]